MIFGFDLISFNAVFWNFFDGRKDTMAVTGKQRLADESYDKYVEIFKLQYAASYTQRHTHSLSLSLSFYLYRFNSVSLFLLSSLVFSFFLSYLRLLPYFF